jgi:hypothetical protein
MKDGQGHVYRQQPTLLEYLEQHGWKTARVRGGEEVAGLCPLHRETRPSFYVNRRKNVFYCHGWGRGGDLIRLMELLEGLSFTQVLLRLRSRAGAAAALEEAVRFYRRQLPRCGPAQCYLEQRGIQAAEAIARMRIGYADDWQRSMARLVVPISRPSFFANRHGGLRAHLESCGYARQEIRDSGLLDVHGRGRFWRCLTFPLHAERGPGGIYTVQNAYAVDYEYFEGRPLPSVEVQSSEERSTAKPSELDAVARD